MKASITSLMALLATTALAATLPSSNGLKLLRSEEINWEDITIVDLEVLDEESFPGQVFKGTAESIVNEMKALKPELFTGETLDARSTIVKRAPIDCGWYAGLNNQANLNGCINAADYIKSLGTRACVVNAGTSTCARVACNNGCGLYLCNTTNGRVSVHCKDISNDFYKIANECTTKYNGVNGKITFNDHFTGVHRC